VRQRLVVSSHAAFAFLRARRATIRAVAALLLLEAIAIGVIAPFVMDSDMVQGVTGMTAGYGLSRAEYARRADANCQRFAQFAATLGNPKTPAGVARQIDRMLPTFWRSYVDQQDLPPPTDQREPAQQWMHAMAAFGGDNEALRAAAARADKGGMARANASAADHAAEAFRLSKELGMRVCFQ
jgi:hypothetical protein